MAIDREKHRLEQLTRMTRRPSHPGEVVADILEDLPITQEALAKRMGISRQSVNDLIQGKRSVTPDMAQRLGKFFGNGPAVWPRLQQSLDLWEVLHADESQYQGIETYRVEAA